jgi:hypothetical protein
MRGGPIARHRHRGHTIICVAYLDGYLCIDSVAIHVTSATVVAVAVAAVADIVAITSRANNRYAGRDLDLLRGVAYCEPTTITTTAAASASAGSTLHPLDAYSTARPSCYSAAVASTSSSSSSSGPDIAAYSAITVLDDTCSPLFSR